MDIGVFGGTFDPVHLGHLRAAEEVRQALGLDRVVFIPACLPPHKRLVEISPPAVRLEMVRRAIAGNPYFSVSDVELKRAGPSYSVDTLAELGRGLAPGDRLWFLLGADAYCEIHTWHRYTEIFSLANVAVMRRPPLTGSLPLPCDMDGDFVPTEAGLRHSSGREVRFLPVTLLDISSTHIREALAEGRSVRYLVPEALFELLTADRPTPQDSKEAHA